MSRGARLVKKGNFLGVEVEGECSIVVEGHLVAGCSITRSSSKGEFVLTVGVLVN